MQENIGELILGTDIDTSGVDDGAIDIEKTLQQLEEKFNKKLSPEVTGEITKEFEEVNEVVQKFQSKYLEYMATLSETKGPIIFEDDLIKVQQLKQEVKEMIPMIEKITGTKVHIPGISDLPKQTKETKKNLKDINSGLGKVIKKVAQWGLAIFGIRSAFGFVTRSISTLSQYNKQLATDLQYIRFAIATISEKLILKLINWVFQLLQYVNYLSMAWFKINLFENAGVDRFKQMNKEAKKLNNQLAGFDEMNVLSDNSSDSSGGVMPSVDLSKQMKEFKAPKWLQTIRDWGDWIIKNWKIVVGVLAGGFAVILGIKLGKWIFDLKNAKDGVKNLGTSFTGFFDGLGKGIEAIAILGGLALVIKSVTDLITAFSASGLKVSDVLGLMGTIIGSLVVLITALTIGANALQSPLAMGGLLVLTGAISAILLVIEKTLPTILNAVGDFIVKIGPTLNKTLEVIGTNIEKIIKALGTSLPPILNSTGNLFDKVFGGISKVIQTIGNTVTNVMRTAKDLVISVLNAILNFINRLGPAINNFVDNAIRAVTKLINFMISGIEYLVNTLVIRAVNKMIEAINKIGEYVGIEIPTVNQVSIPRFVPKFAKGTILNAPGKGVPVGGYQGLAGEAGREAYLPLSDTQLLQELGSTIGRYVTINATIPVYAYNRQVDRQIKRITAENNFAGNR